jgi:hypothetical protein
MTQYTRHKTGLTVEWEPEHDDLAYQAIVDCDATAPETVSEARDQCPIHFAEGDDSYRDVRERYQDLLSAQTQ